MPAIRTQIEDKIIGLLAPMKTAAMGGSVSGYLRAVKPYNSELEGEDPDGIRDVLQGQLPSLLVYTDAGRPRVVQQRRRRYVNEIAVVILVCSATFRSREAQVRGGVAGDADPGIYQIIEDVWEVLAGVQLDVAGTGIMQPTDEDAMIQRPDVCVWRLRYTVPVDFARPVPDGYELTGQATWPAPVESEYTEIDGRHHIADVALASGTGDSFAVAGGVVTLTDAGAAFIAAHVGHSIVIEGATSKGNNGVFEITAVPSGTQARWNNPKGITEAFAGTWKIRPFVVKATSPVT